jgi:hypothetical protein
MNRTLRLIALLLASVALPAAVARADFTTITDPISGELLEMWTIDSAPPDLVRYEAQIASRDAMRGATMLSGVPTSGWNYGCSATSAGMMFGYYDRLDYPFYDGDVPLYMGDMDDGDNHPLIATPDHVTDYWIGYNQPGPDPWEGNWTEHTWADCTADFLGTNQWKWDYQAPWGSNDHNTDGATTVWSYTSSPAKLYDYIPLASYGLPQTAFCHGLRLFTESRGWEVVHDGSNYQNYTQKVDARVTGGFSFDDYMAEIDAGRPAVIHLAGHTILGVGYDPSGPDGQTVYMHDTWGDYVAHMPWGGSYSGMEMQDVTILELTEIPEPGTLALISAGLVALGVWRRRRPAG